MTILTVSGIENQNTSQVKEFSPKIATPDHLGGHLNKTHLDNATLEFLIQELGIKSMLDIGCGPGGMVQLAQSKGLKAIGVDGDFNLNSISSVPICTVDFTQNKVPFEDQFDLAWAVEFLEHVEEQYAPNYMHAFSLCQYALITAAPPGTPGHHHVNCQLPEYWIDVFKRYGFTYDPHLTETIKERSDMVKPFVKHNGMFFRKG